MSDDRKVLLLVALGVIWAGIALVQYVTQPEEREVPLTFVSGQAAKSAVPGADTSFTVRPLQRPAHTLATSARKNIFAPLGVSHDVPVQTAHDQAGARRSKPASRRAQESDVAQAAAQPDQTAPQSNPTPVWLPMPSPEELAVQAAQQQLEVRLQQIREQMVQYQYLGFQSLDGEQRAFIGKDNNVFVVRLGDKIDGRFVVQSITGAYVKLREPRAHVEATLALKTDG